MESRRISNFGRFFSANSQFWSQRSYNHRCRRTSGTVIQNYRCRIRIPQKPVCNSSVQGNHFRNSSWALEERIIQWHWGFDNWTSLGCPSADGWDVRVEHNMYCSISSQTDHVWAAAPAIESTKKSTNQDRLSPIQAFVAKRVDASMGFEQIGTSVVKEHYQGSMWCLVSDHDSVKICMSTY